MEKIIAACGNDCSLCPRYMPKTDGELTQTAQLWHRLGLRDHVVSNEEIQCFGCTPHNWCRYKIVACAVDRKIENCGRCTAYPCPQIMAAFEQTRMWEASYKLYGTEQEYDILCRAFCEKEENLNAQALLMK